MAVDQTMLAMRLPKCEMTSGIQSYDKSPLQASGVQAPHANEATQHACSQLGVGSSASVSQEMIQGVVYRPRLLLGLGQAVEIVEHFGAAGIEIEIQLPATAELEQVQTDPPPNEEPFIVDDQGRKAGIRHAIQPLIKLRPEVTDGCQ
jgi:hypothetical protein